MTKRTPLRNRPIPALDIRGWSHHAQCSPRAELLCLGWANCRPVDEGGQGPLPVSRRIDPLAPVDPMKFVEPRQGKKVTPGIDGRSSTRHVTDALVAEWRRMLGSGMTFSAVARATGWSYKTIKAHVLHGGYGRAFYEATY